MFTRNQYETTVDTTTGGTAQDTTILTGVDDASNRSSHIPDGSILHSVVVIAYARQVSAGMHRLAMWRRPGTETSPTDFLSSYFDSSDPMTAAAIRARSFKLAGPRTQVQVSGALTPVKMVLKWRGKLRMRDGDDIILTHNFPVTGDDVTYTIYARYSR